MSSTELRKRNEMRDVVRLACKGGDPQPLVDYIKANGESKADIKRMTKAFHTILRRREFKTSVAVAIQSSVIAELLKDVKEDQSDKIDS